MEGKPAKDTAADIAALFNRAGLGGTGRYREFASKRVIVWPEGNPTDLAAQEPEVLSSTATPGGGRPFAAVAGAPSAALDDLLGTHPGRSKSRQAGCATVALFSLAGGVGKTTIAATLGRVLSESNRRVVVANGGSEFALQYLFGERAQKVGPFTFLAPPVGVAALAMTIVELGENDATAEQQDALKYLAQASLHTDMALLDLAACTCGSSRNLFREADHVLIPVTPDMHSAVTLNSLEALVRAERPAGSRAHYILNRYDPARASHREMRNRLQTTLGAALLPFFIRDEARVQEAMNHGITVADYAPEAEVVSDFMALGKWAEQLQPRSHFLKGAHV